MSKISLKLENDVCRRLCQDKLSENDLNALYDAYDVIDICYQQILDYVYLHSLSYAAIMTMITLDSETEIDALLEVALQNLLQNMNAILCRKYPTLIGGEKVLEYAGRTKQNLLDIDISILGYSNRVRNSLRRANIDTIGELTERIVDSECWASTIRNLGPVGKSEIISRLKEENIISN